MKKIELYNDHAKAVLEWLVDTIHDMEVDEEFINEHSPGLLDGLRKIVSDLEGKCNRDRDQGPGRTDENQE